MKSITHERACAHNSSTPRAALTVPDFCSATTLGRTKFYSEVAASRIHILKAGRRTLVPVTEVQAYLDLLAEEGGIE